MELKDSIMIDASVGSGFSIVGLSISAYIIQVAYNVQTANSIFWLGIFVGGLLTAYGVYLLSRAARMWRNYRKKLDFTSSL